MLVFLLLGDMYEIGADKGKYYSINIPLKDGIDDQSEGAPLSPYCNVFLQKQLWHFINLFDHFMYVCMNMHIFVQEYNCK